MVSRVVKSKVSQEFDFKHVLSKPSGLSDFKLPVVPDTLPVVEKLKNRLLDDLSRTSGSVFLNYSYGLNTVFIDTSRSIGSIFTTRGYFPTGLLGLPVSVRFNYSTFLVPLGANNYFRISLDQVKLIEQQKEKLGTELKLASDFTGATSLRGHFEALWQVYKVLDVSMRAERFVLGNFYQNYYRTQYEQFPYLMSIQTRFKL